MDQANGHFSTIDDNAGPPRMAVSRLIMDGRSPTQTRNSISSKADVRRRAMNAVTAMVMVDAHTGDDQCCTTRRAGPVTYDAKADEGPPECAGTGYFAPGASCRNARIVSIGMTQWPACGTTHSCARGIVLNISTACSGVTMSPSPTMIRVGALPSLADFHAQYSRSCRIELDAPHAKF